MDNKSLYKIYSQSEIGKKWLISLDSFLDIIFCEEVGIIVKKYEEHNNSFAVVRYSEKFASIIILISIGDDTEKEKILKRIITDCEDRGVEDLYLGHKVGRYMWPGLPFESNDLNFYLENGFVYYWDNPSEDMILDIVEFEADKKAYVHIEKYGYSITLAKESDSEKIINFEEKEFPNWVKHFKRVIEEDEIDKILLVKDKDDVIVGSSILFWGDYKFRELFDKLTGGAGAVGIGEEYRGRGLGLAMQTKALEILRDKGVEIAIVEYTGEAGFYRKLGFRTWRKFHMLKKNLFYKRSSK